eukprot:TRINITY_DN5491_c0_g1_i1.p2 TRINITY_DN5491_c0_g1~~TRINITY_DN5491_c0_g1_i1.p2  ORF type:complete len:152 (+),score=12.10 TRINITY_DN5491_c0_g1_i1:2-457(+)
MKRGDEKVPIKNGTIAYLPKDAFTHMAATTKTDVYALGLILWELWHGIFWFSIYDAEKRRRRATIDGMHGYVPRCASNSPAPFAEVVHACLSKDPEQRPEVKAICRKLTDLIPTVSPNFLQTTQGYEVLVLCFSRQLCWMYRPALPRLVIE